MPFVLAIDQGTTSSRAILFRDDIPSPRSRSRSSRSIFRRSGWVEHEPEDIWTATLATCREALAKARRRRRATSPAIGITNQRETTRGLGPRDRPADPPRHRLAGPPHRRRLREAEGAPGTRRWSRRKTGLLLDPYFSGTKIAWLLDHVPGARAAGRSAASSPFGTVDSFLLWRLTGGKVHATDATNASRTLLFDIHTGAWDDELLALFGVPRALLPEVRDCSARFRRRPRPSCSARRSRSAASPATSRRRRSARPASRPA